MNTTCDNYIGSKLIFGTASNYTPVYNPSRGAGASFGKRRATVIRRFKPLRSLSRLG